MDVIVLGADTKPAATTAKPSRGGHQSNYYNPKRGGRGGYHRGSYNNSYHNQSYYGGRGGRGGGGYYQVAVINYYTHYLSISQTYMRVFGLGSVVCIHVSNFIRFKNL